MIPIVTPEEMAAIDAAAPEPVEVLIERAGCGGRPGGAADARRHVRPHGRRDRRQGQQRRRRPGRRRACSPARGVRVRMFDAADCPPALPPADLVIDAAYGTGFHGDVDARRDVGDAPVLAVDIPSGVDGLTGEAGARRARRRPHGHVRRAEAGPAARRRARRWPARSRSPTSGSTPRRRRAHLVEAADVADWWRPRPPTRTSGRAAVRVVAGSPGMTGAAHLVGGGGACAPAPGWCACRSPGVDAADAPIEVVRQPLPGRATGRPRCSTTSTASTPSSSGPGSAASDDTVAAVASDGRRRRRCPLVVDGDGLFALAWSAGRRGAAAAPPARRRPCSPRTTASTSCSPGTPPGADRLAAARRLAADTGAVVLLKGPTTVVAEPDGDVLRGHRRRRAPGHRRHRRRARRASSARCWPTGMDAVRRRRRRRVAARPRPARVGPGDRAWSPATCSTLHARRCWTSSADA